MERKGSHRAFFSYELGDPFAGGRGGDHNFISIAIDHEAHTGYALQYMGGSMDNEYVIFPFDTQTHNLGTPIRSALFEGAGMLTLDAPRRTLWVASGNDELGPILVPVDLAQTPPRIEDPITTSAVENQQFIDFEIYPHSTTGYAVIVKMNGEPSEIVPVDLVNHTFGDPIPVGLGFADNIAFDEKTNKAYVTAEGGNIVPVDLVNRKPLDPISLSAPAIDIVTDVTRRTAYALTYLRPSTVLGPANAGRYFIEPFNLDTLLPAKPIPVASDIPDADAPSVINVAIDEALHSVYLTVNVAAGATAALRVIDTLTNTPCPPVSLSPDAPAYTDDMPIGIDPATHTVYIGSGGSWIVPVYPIPTPVAITYPPAGSTVQINVPLIIAGTGEPGAVVQTKLVYDSGIAAHLPNTTVQADGTWQTPAGTPRLDTRIHVEAVATQSMDGLTPSEARSDFYMG